MKKIYRAILLIFAIAAMMMISSMAMSVSWDSFSKAIFEGINVTPTLCTGTLTYTLSFTSDNPTITIDGHVYQVLWIQGFYAVSSKSTSELYAGGVDILGSDDKPSWTWDTSPNTNKNYESPNYFYVAGWNAQGNDNRLTPEKGSMNFTYTQLSSPSDASIILGLHIGYYDDINQTNVTKCFIPDNTYNDTPQLPEFPASLLAIISTPILGISSLIRRRVNR